MEPSISVEDVKRFQEEGAVYLKGIFSQEWVEKIKTGIQKNLDSPSEFSERLALKEGQGAYFNDYCNWQRIPEFREYAFESCAGELSAKLMNSKYSVFYHEHVLNKEPGTEKETPWHQDQAYWPLEGWNVVSIWMPVDHVPLQSTLRFVKGSHKWGWYHPRKFASEENYPVEAEGEEWRKAFKDVPIQEIESGKHEILGWACEPGDAVVFHGKTLHGASGNSSSSVQRRVLSTRWVGENTTLAERPWQVSPPYLGGLKPGDTFMADIFPLVYGTI